MGTTWAVGVAAVLVAGACGTARDTASPPSPPPPGPRPASVAPPAGPWMTATATGALRITTPARWTCDWQGADAAAARSFRPGMRTSCVVPVEFLHNLVFGCPDLVTRPHETARATYDLRGRLIAYGPTPDYQVTYGWDDDDRLITRNGAPVRVTREPGEIVFIEDAAGMDVRTVITLDEQARPVAIAGLASITLGWRSDDLVSVHWQMVGLDPLDATLGPCGDRAPALAEDPRPR